MTLWGTSFLHLDKTPIEDVAMYIQRKKPHILLSSIERLTDKSLLTELLTTKISYVAVDESQVQNINQGLLEYFFQVADPKTGWTEFCPFHPEIWLHLTTAHNCPILWSSATCSEDILRRLCQAFSVPREEVYILQMSTDRPNIFIKKIVTKKALWLGYVNLFFRKI